MFCFSLGETLVDRAYNRRGSSTIAVSIIVLRQQFLQYFYIFFGGGGIDAQRQLT